MPEINQPSRLSHAAELRRAFDASFAAEPRQGGEAAEDLLSLTVGGDRYAVRLRQVRGIVKHGKTVAVPSRVKALAGLASLRGEVLPVYSLALLLGYAQAEDARWLLLAGQGARLAFAIAGFGGCFPVLREAFVAGAPASGPGRSGEGVLIRSELHVLLDLSVLCDSITAERA